MDAKTQAAERLLRGLGIAVKTFALYPPPHPVTEHAVDTFLASLRRYQESHGSFVVRIAKQSLLVDAHAFKGGTHGSLALFLFSRKVTSIRTTPEVGEQALLTLASALSMDRAALEAAGGVRHLLRQAGVKGIAVTEVAGEEELEDEAEALDPAGILETLIRGRPSLAEREQMLELLHAGPEQVATLLEQIQAMAGAVEGSAGSIDVEPVHRAVRGMDRLILDEPFEDQPGLRDALAGGLGRLGEPARSAVLRALVEAPGDGTARRLHAARPEALSALAPAGGDRQAQAEAVAFPPGFEFGDAEAAGPPDGGRLTEQASTDEADARRAAGATLVAALRHMPEGLPARMIDDMPDGIMAHLTWLADRREYAAVGATLAALREIGAGSAGAGGPAADGLLSRTAEGPLLGALIEALWSARGTPAADEIRACLEALGGAPIGPLVRMLGEESRGGVRALLGDLLAAAAADRVDDLGAWVTDERWYVLRNLAGVLGRLRNPRAVQYLSQLTGHQDYRVRRETVDALAAVGTADAQAVLTGFLDDPDERLQLRALQSLDAEGAGRAVPRLLAILEQADPLHRQFALKQAVLETLGRIGARESLPALARLSQGRLALGPQAQELRRLAAQTAEIIERKRSSGARPAGEDDTERPAS